MTKIYDTSIGGTTLNSQVYEGEELVIIGDVNFTSLLSPTLVKNNVKLVIKDINLFNNSYMNIISLLIVVLIVVIFFIMIKL